ncbi:GumC family protein [Silicimonas sp. MF1-12-2]|uniref:GumC family protein n=1 Tax=Silicimonas sp. MF1-12-2 TaxID=3384793 RepID=UPI0039B486F3
MQKDDLGLRGLLETLRRQYLLIAFTILLCVSLAVAYLAAVTPIYSSSALIMVDPFQRDLLETDPGSSVSQGTANARVESEVEILRSDAIALTVVDEQDLISDPEFGPQVGLREKIERALGIERSRTVSPENLVRNTVSKLKSATEVRRRGLTYLIEVSVSSKDSERSAELTNALAESSIAEQLSAKIQRTLAARDVLQVQMRESQAALARSETALDDFIRDNFRRIEEQTGRGDLSGTLAMIEQAEDTRLQTEIQLREFQQELENRNWENLVAGLEDDALRELADQRAGIEARLGRVVSGSQAEIDLQAELAALDRRLEEQAAEQIGSLQAQLATVGAEEESYREQLRDTLFSGQLPADILTEVFAIQQNAAIARTQYQNLVVLLNNLETSAGVQVADSRIVSPALVPTSPSSPNTRLVMVMALFFGAALGVFFAFLREFFIGGFSSTEQLQAAAQAPVATAIPLVGTRNLRSPSDLVSAEPLSHYSEAMRRLRASIDRSLQTKSTVDPTELVRSKVILVASASPKEGKSTTALSLARTYALAGKKTLLFDADLRRPTLHTLVGTEPQKGIIDYLESNEKYGKLKEYFWEDSESGLTMVLGKSRSAVPTDRLLSSQGFEQTISTAKQHFDVIVIDTSPLLPVVDCRYILPLADAVLMLVRWSSTSQSELQVALSSIRSSAPDDAPLLLALSQKPESRRERKRYYYYGYSAKLDRV